MAYECDLRRLFRPPIDHLPIDEQLTHYRQRDLVPSHLYRLGSNLFGGSSTNIRRHRIIDSSLHTPHGRVCHEALLQRSLDGREVSTPALKETRCSTRREEYSHSRVTRSQSEPSVKLSDSMIGSSSNEAQYKKWLADRRTLRGNLDGLGANERWLCSKERTPLESSLLTKLRNDPRKATTSKVSDLELPKVSTQSSEVTSSKSPNPRKALLKFKRQMIKEITQLEQYLANNRRRSVSLLATADKNRTRFISVSDMLSVMSKMKAPLSQAATEILLQVLDIRDDGLLDYQQIMNGGILRAVEDHFQRLEASLSEDNDAEVPVESCLSDDLWSIKAADLEKKHGAPSTLVGNNGSLADQYKQEEVKQFSMLINHCKENGILLNWQVAEKALLIPPDKPKRECLKELRQAGLTLLSRHFAESPQEQAERKQKDTYEGFGRAYKEIRGKRKSVYMKLPTGGVRVKAKIDCWLSFEEYLMLTEHIRAKPGFTYKDHGLPDDNAFWPGALLDKLRLWMPRETLLDKPYSLYNIFQPVQHPKFYNPQAPMVEQKSSWPENESGYVQFGGQSRKQYQL